MILSVRKISLHILSGIGKVEMYYCYGRKNCYGNGMGSIVTYIIIITETMRYSPSAFDIQEINTKRFYLWSIAKVSGANYKAM